ncbi:MAG: hypothetical protein WCF65_08990 [Parachlamydiaceae bacterium]
MNITSNIQIIGAYDGEVDNMNISFPEISQQKMNEAIYKEWVSLHEEKYIGPLKDLQHKITHVSYEAFKNNLKKTVDRFINNVGKKSYVAFVEPNKSQQWVTTIAMAYGFKASAYVRLGQDGANCLSSALLNTDEKDERFATDYVIIDDASYSGNQMANNISAAHHVLQEKFKDKNIIFHILLPYITNVAKNKMENLRNKPITIILYTSEIIQTVEEAVSKKNRIIKQVLWNNSLPEEQNRKVKTTALHWFDHKIPNSMSFPDVLASGLVTQPKSQNHKGKYIQFIPSITPPYKSEELFSE